MCLIKTIHFQNSQNDNVVMNDDEIHFYVRRFVERFHGAGQRLDQRRQDRHLHHDVGFFTRQNPTEIFVNVGLQKRTDLKASTWRRASSNSVPWKLWALRVRRIVFQKGIEISAEDEATEWTRLNGIEADGMVAGRPFSRQRQLVWNTITISITTVFHTNNSSKQQWKLFALYYI